jgi:hypothetical protein
MRRIFGLYSLFRFGAYTNEPPATLDNLLADAGEIRALDYDGIAAEA